MLAEKAGLRLTARHFRASGFNYTVIIVGTGDSGQAIAESIRSHRFWGFRVLGMVESGSESDGATSSRWPVLGTLHDLPSIVENNVVDDVIFAVGRRDLDRMEDLFLALQERSIQTRFALRLFLHTPAKIDLEDLDELPQLWKVLKGEMSMVGPRPPIPEEVAQYRALAASAPGDEAWAHLPVADQRPQRHPRLQPLDGARPRVHLVREPSATRRCDAGSW